MIQFLWPTLPIELKRLVLEFVALDDPKDARSLRLVSRDINVFVLPLIFRHLSIDSIAHLHAFTRTILPPPSPHHKLKNTLPDPPCPLSVYNIVSLALTLPVDRPSIENSLAAVGPAFARLRYLATSSRNLSANAFWLRQNHVKPTHMMLLHPGCPRPVNWRDSVFSNVTHIFTSSLDSHGISALCDIPGLTHIAVSTRLELSDSLVRQIAGKLEMLLDTSTMPNIISVVLALSLFPSPPPHFLMEEYENYSSVLSRWRNHLERCLASSKFYVLPDPHSPQKEWERMVHGGDPDIWERAALFRQKHPHATVFDPQEFEATLDSIFGANALGVADEDSDMEDISERQRKRIRMRWNVDLVQREDFQEAERLDPEEVGEFVGG